MWSEVNKEYVVELVKTHAKEYPYYVAFTNTNVDGGYNTQYPSFYVYLSKEPITQVDLYTFEIPDGIVYEVYSSNASSTFHQQRVNVSAFTGTLYIDVYEFIYSNAESESYTIQPDILKTNDYVTQNHFDGGILAVLIIFFATIFAKLIRGRI